MNYKKYDFYDPTVVGKRIKTIRESFNCTMEQFGQLINGTTKAAVFNWEKGKRLPNNGSLELIAILGKTTAEDIVYGNFEKYLVSLFTTESFLYSKVKDKLKHSQQYELFSFYESVSEEKKSLIIKNVIEDTKRLNFDYFDIANIVDLFLMHTENSLKINLFVKTLPPKVENLLIDIEKNELTIDELKLLIKYLSNKIQK